MISLLKVINFSNITIIKISFISDLAIFFCLNVGYLNSLASEFTLINILNMLICFGKFSSFLQPNLFDGKDAKSINRVVYIRAVSIRNNYIKNTYTKSTTGNTFFIKSTYVKDAFVKIACTKSTYWKDIDAVKYLEMHL